MAEDEVVRLFWHLMRGIGDLRSDLTALGGRVGSLEAKVQADNLAIIGALSVVDGKVAVVDGKVAALDSKVAAAEKAWVRDSRAIHAMLDVMHGSTVQKQVAKKHGEPYATPFVVRDLYGVARLLLPKEAAPFEDWEYTDVASVHHARAGALVDLIYDLRPTWESKIRALEAAIAAPAAGAGAAAAYDGDDDDDEEHQLLRNAKRVLQQWEEVGSRGDADEKRSFVLGTPGLAVMVLSAAVIDWDGSKTWRAPFVASLAIDFRGHVTVWPPTRSVVGTTSSYTVALEIGDANAHGTDAAQQQLHLRLAVLELALSHLLKRSAAHVDFSLWGRIHRRRWGDEADFDMKPAAHFAIRSQDPSHIVITNDLVR